MITPIKWGLLVFALFAAAYVVETKAILDLESSDSEAQDYENAPGYAP